MTQPEMWSTDRTGIALPEPNTLTTHHMVDEPHGFQEDLWHQLLQGQDQAVIINGVEVNAISNNYN